MLNWIKEHYGDWEIIITENGVSDKGELDDQPRIKYYKVRSNSLIWKLEPKYLNRTNTKPQNYFRLNTFGTNFVLVFRKERSIFIHT